MNEIQQWINTDAALSNILVEIQNTEVPITEQAEMAFQKLADLHGLAKMPGDIIYDDDGDDYQEKVSVYEMLGMIKFLQPDDDQRGQVLSAIYYVKNGYVIELKDVLKKKYGKKVPLNVGVGFINDNSAVEIIFVTGGQSWSDLGCKLFMKEA